MRENRSTEWVRGAAAVVLVAALVASGAAQDKKKKADEAKSATLAQAVVVEIYEHNLGAAMEMYRAIMNDEDRTAETRTQARLRLAKAYRRLGQNAEAEAALQKAAAGAGPAAKEAAAILAGNAQDDGDLVKAKVQQALTAMRLTGKPDKSDLAWIGQPAVPYLIKAVDGEKADLRFITNASTVLFRLGGPKVLAWIDTTKKSTDVLRKRAVIKGFRIGSKAVRGKLATLVTDSDVTVRRELVDNSSQILNADQFIDALEDADAMVRKRAMEALWSYWRTLDHAATKFANFERLLPYLSDMKPDTNMIGAGYSLGAWIAGHQFFAGMTQTVSTQPKPSFPATDAGRRSILRAVGLDCFRYARILWPPFGDTAPKNVYANEVVAAAKKIGSVESNTGSRDPNNQGNTATIYRITSDLLRFWDRASMGAVLKLVELGYDSRGVLGKWVSEHGTAADLSAVADRLHHFDPRYSVGVVCDWMTKVGAPGNVLDRLTVLADRFYGSKSNRRSAFEAVLRTIRSINTEKSVDYIVTNIRQQKDDFLKCITGKIDAADEKSILQRLLVMPGSGEWVEEMRAFAFKALLQKHADPGDPMLFARAYELGMGDSGPCHDPRQGGAVGGNRKYRGVFWAYAGKGATQVQSSPAVRAKIMDACLGTGQPEAFKDLARALSWGTDREIADVVSRRVAHTPKLEDNRGADVRSGFVYRVMQNLARGAAGAELAVAALTHELPAVRRVAIQSLRRDFDSDPKVALAVLASLADEDVMVRRYAASFLSGSSAKVEGLIPAMTARLSDSDPKTVVDAIQFHSHRSPATLLGHDRLLKHEDSSVRYNFASALLTNHGTKVIEIVGPVLVDERISETLRIRLVKKLGSLMDLQAVPFLLQALKSPGVQTEAQKQLEAIRFYHEESSKWNRVMQGAGFKETSAAEALIEQAKSGKKEIRLAAIASLGTLGEVETLPFLVKLMGQADPDIARAAKDAVDRINRASRKK